MVGVRDALINVLGMVDEDGPLAIDGLMKQTAMAVEGDSPDRGAWAPKP
jgi:hypothetical protein